MKKFLTLVVISLVLFSCDDNTTKEEYNMTVRPITNKIARPYYDPVIQHWSQKYYVIFNNGERNILLPCKDENFWSEAKAVKVTSNSKKTVVEIMR